MSHVTRTWQVENTWSCPSCSVLNRGRDLDCRLCGARKSAQVEDHLADPDAPAVTDPELLRKATAGSNWACAYCGGQERNLQGECAHCGGPKAQASSRRPLARDPLPIWKRRLIGPIAGWHLAIGLAIAATIGCLVWLLVWILTPRTVHARVIGTSWQYTVNLRERVQLHNDGEWDRPGGRGFYNEPAFNESCERRLHGTEDCNPYQCNPHQVPYSCNCTSYSCNCTSSCTNNKNGFSSCKQSCSTCQRCGTCYRTEYSTCYQQCQVYKDWCSYDYYDWPVKLTRQMRGDDQSCRWPDLTAGDNQRLQKAEEYDVQFKDEEDVLDYAPKSLDDYKRFSTGDAWILKVGKVRGRVESLQRETAEEE